MTDAFKKIKLPQQTAWREPVLCEGGKHPARGVYEGVFYNLRFKVKDGKIVLYRMHVAIRQVETRPRMWPFGKQTKRVTLKELTTESIFTTGVERSNSFIDYIMDDLQSEWLNKGFDLDSDFLLWALSGAEKRLREIIRELNDERGSNSLAYRQQAA